MNLDALWQTHRRFITGVAIGTAGFVAGLMVIQLTAGKRLDSAEARIASAERKLRTPSYGAAEVTRLQQRLNELQQQNRQLADSVLPPRRPEFRPQPGQSPSQHYIEFTGQRRQELIQYALGHDMDLDETLGLPTVSPTDPQVIERALRGFDVMDRLVHLAVASGARSVENAEIQTRSSTRRGKTGAQVLDTTPVTVDVVLPEDHAEVFTQAVTGAQPGLPLVRLELGPTDARKHTRKVTLEFAVGELPAEAAGDAAGGGSAQ